MKKIGRWNLNEEDKPEINIAPLLDMVFILLIFFIVTTVFVEETGVEVKKPTAASAKDLDKNSIMLAITASGEIIYSGRKQSINSLRAIVSRQIRKRKMPVIIVADRDANSGLLVDVIDECKLSGAENVSIAASRETGR